MTFWSSWRARFTFRVRTANDSSSAASRRVKSSPVGVGAFAGTTAFRGAWAVAPLSSSEALRSRAKISFTTSVPESSSGTASACGPSSFSARRRGLASTGPSGTSWTSGTATSGTVRSGVPASISSSVSSGSLGRVRRTSSAALRAASSELLMPESTPSTWSSRLDTNEPSVSRAARSWSICRCRALRLMARSFKTTLRASPACSTMARPCSLA